MCGEHNVRATTRDNTGQNTDNWHTPSPRIEIEISFYAGIEPGPLDWKAETLPTTPRWWTINISSLNKYNQSILHCFS